jgi:hypothetical protein
MDEFEQTIQRQAQRFDLKPLLDLLRSHGYRGEDILFESSTERTSATLVESVTFVDRPARRVLIRVNLGLLGDNSLLPSYFLQVVEDSRDPERFYDFIRFFDHVLISRFVRAVYPEDDHDVYKDFARVQAAWFRMLTPASTGTLEWLFQLLFPDLRAKASRRRLSESSATHACRIGESRLDGSGVLGREYESMASGFAVTLFADDSVDSLGRSLPHRIRARLDELALPLLAPFRIPLVVRLEVRYDASWARVDFPATDEHGYLGFERVKGEPDTPNQIILFRGIVGHA